MFFINGMFWQEGLVPYVGNDQIMGEVVMLGIKQTEALFSGVIGLLAYSGTDGYLKDTFGESDVSDVKLSRTNLSFTKQYIHREDTISYSFTRGSDDVWVGTWEGDAVGKGEAKCILTKIPQTFFQKPK